MVITALEIAVKALRSCYAEQGIYAGLHHFDDYWTRDFCFSSFGANRLKDFGIVKKHFQLLLNDIKSNGQLPLRIGDNFIKQKLKFIGIKVKQKRFEAIYSEDKSGAIPSDENSLFIIAFLDYIKQSRDKDFLIKNFDKIKKIIDWNQTREETYLIKEKPFGNWCDSIKKSGKVLFTNVCYYKALVDFVELCKLVKKDYFYYNNKAKSVKEEINKLFWNGNYYSDWVDEKRYDFFSTDGNLLAVLWGVADKKQGLSIQNCIKDFKINEPVPSKTNYPKYPFSMVSLQLAIVLNGDYHNQACWLWLGCVDVLAKLKLGMKKEAKKVLEKIAGKIVEYGNVYELYDQEGRPWSRLIYKAEVPLAWNSGMFIYAARKLKILMKL